ncbi:MAG: ABC transporter substrate-binding protein [Deinococcota bacterium]
MNTSLRTLLIAACLLFTSSFASELTMAVPNDGYRTDERANVGMYPLNANIYDTLVYVSPDYSVEPMLATSWEFIEPNTYRFFLREDVVFHDGSAFTAEDVKYSIDRVVAARPSGGLGADSVVIVDDYTLDITPESPNRRLLQQLTHPSWSILASGADPVTNPIGTGPFKYVEYAPEEYITVTRNDAYWGEAAQLEGITFRFIPDPNTRILALQAGEVDVAYDLPREQTEDVTGSNGLSVTTSQVGAYAALYVNVSGNEGYELGSDPAVRAAVARAIDKSLIVDDVWLGNATVNSSMIPERILGEFSSVVQGQAYDPEAAEQILGDAGWVDSNGDGTRDKNGRELNLTMVVGFPNPDIHRPMPEIVQALLADIGINMTIDITPDTASYDARLEEGSGDLWAEVGNQNDANPCFLPNGLFYSQSPWGAYPLRFAPGEDFDVFIEQCLAATTTTEVAEAAANAMKLIIDDENVVIPIAGIFRIYGHRDDISGFEAHPSTVNQRWNLVSQ